MDAHKIRATTYDNKDFITLVAITDGTQHSVALANELCEISEFEQVIIVLPKGTNLSYLKHGIKHDIYDTALTSCNNEFTGMLRGRSLSAGSATGITHMHNMKNVLRGTDFPPYPVAIMGSVPKHYIFIGPNSPRYTYGCYRSHAFSSAHLSKYHHYKDTYVAFNLHAPKCDQAMFSQGSVDIITPFEKDSETFFTHIKTSSCSDLAIRRSKAEDIFERLSFDGSYGWNQLVETVFEKDEMKTLSSLYLLAF
jgi:hypothetical protein